MVQYHILLILGTKLEFSLSPVMITDALNDLQIARQKYIDNMSTIEIQNNSESFAIDAVNLLMVSRNNN